MQLVSCTLDYTRLTSFSAARINALQQQVAIQQQAAAVQMQAAAACRMQNIQRMQNQAMAIQGLIKQKMNPRAPNVMPRSSIVPHSHLRTAHGWCHLYTLVHRVNI